jgi:hypothetical protein
MVSYFFLLAYALSYKKKSVGGIFTERQVFKEGIVTKHTSGGKGIMKEYEVLNFFAPKIMENLKTNKNYTTVDNDYCGNVWLETRAGNSAGVPTKISIRCEYKSNGKEKYFKNIKLKFESMEFKNSEGSVYIYDITDFPPESIKSLEEIMHNMRERLIIDINFRQNRVEEKNASVVG